MPEPPPRPPIASAALSVVLPVRNAEPFLKELVGAWDSVLQGLGPESEIILVDDGSNDGTKAAADALAVELPRLRVLALRTPQGVGAAFRTGLAAAKHPLLVSAAGDVRYQPADLQSFLKEIDQADIVAGRRSMPSPGLVRWTGRVFRLAVRIIFGIPAGPVPPWLGWRNRLFRWIVRGWTGARCSDINCPFKLYRREVFARLPVQSDGPFVHAEILAKANFLECPLTEVDVTGPPDDPAQELRPLLREAWRVLCHPEFRDKKKTEPRNDKKKKRKGK